MVAAELNVQAHPLGHVTSYSLAGAERSSALQRALLGLLMPTHKRHFARGVQLLGSTTYRRAKLFESGERGVIPPRAGLLRGF
jgi:hypothetical protein